MPRTSLVLGPRAVFAAIVCVLCVMHTAAAQQTRPGAPATTQQATQPAGRPAALPSELPPEVTQALQRARIPLDAVSVLVEEAGTAAPHRLWLNAGTPRNPASVTKLITTYAALDLLGPAHTWATPVWLTGPVRDGVLEGSVFIKGSGDPSLVVERLWLLVRRLQQRGIREIRGDIVLDRSAFTGPDAAPADFDGEATRPYNVRADALLLNYKSQVFTFTPDNIRGVAVVGVEPPLDGVLVDATVPLSAEPCADWRAALKPTFTDPNRVRFAGRFATACGELPWAVAYTEPASYNARLLRALWQSQGGVLAGSVREGPSPPTPATFELSSPSLAEVVRDINKFSNNVMAQQLFLTLGLVVQGEGSPAGARQAVRDWLAKRTGEDPAGVWIDNGSGLSRDTRISALALGRLLQRAWSGPVMPELLASLPINGLDGTLRRSRATPGRAHLKTGSLRDVLALGGYVLADSGRRYVLVAFINHPNAAAGRPALDLLVQWTLNDGAESR